MPRMPFVRLALVLSAIHFLALAPPAASADYSPEELKADLKLLEDAKVPHGDQDLIKFFKSRVPSDQDRERIDALVKRMASNVYKEREQARVAVEKEGPLALPMLRQVLQGNPELEVKQRVQQCIKTIEKKSPDTLVLAAARLLNHRRVDGAAAALMDFIPCIVDDAVEEEISVCIYDLGLIAAKLELLPPTVKTGTLDPVMLPALADKHAGRRALAALVVARRGDAEQRKAAAKLLQDDVPVVRWRAAQGLALAGDKSAVPVLVDLLGKSPMPVALQAADLLNVIAQGKGPTDWLEEAEKSRMQCRAAWDRWWKDNKDKVDFARLAQESPFSTPTALARNAASQLLNGILKRDLALLTKFTDVPFALGPGAVLNTRAELDQIFQQVIAAPQPPQVKWKIIKVMPVAEYVKKAEKADVQFLQTPRPGQTHIVFIESQEANQKVETVPVFVVVRGGKGRCIGIGTPTR